MSTRGTMFLRAIGCEGEVKDGSFIANILIQAIEQVGPQNVVQVITDNAKNCRVVKLLVEERFKHIFWTPCILHSLNLMLRKIGKKIEWIKQMYEDAQEIQMFITNHYMSQAIFRQFSRLELLKVAKIRFASNTIVLRRLVKVKEALSRMVNNTNWSVWRQSSSTRAAAIKAMILDDSWWDRVEQLLTFIEPILSMILYTNMDRLCLGASSSSSERNCSTYSFIHSIKRKRLHSKEAEDLIYVHSNLRLLTHKNNTYKKGDAKHWDVEPESAELDDSIAHLDALAVDDDVHKLPSDTEASLRLTLLVLMSVALFMLLICHS